MTIVLVILLQHYLTLDYSLSLLAFTALRYSMLYVHLRGGAAYRVPSTRRLCEKSIMTFIRRWFSLLRSMCSLPFSLSPKLTPVDGCNQNACARKTHALVVAF
eukprot:743949-Prorocentrum_minimum.AAC.2